MGEEPILLFSEARGGLWVVEKLTHMLLKITNRGKRSFDMGARPNP